MASDEESSVPLFRVSYEQLVERSKKFLDSSSHDTQQKMLVNNSKQDTLESRDESQGHHGMVHKDITQEQRQKDARHHELRTHSRGRGHLLKPKESEDNNWDILWTEWRDIEKKLEKSCSIWKGASDMLEEIIDTCRRMEKVAYHMVKVQFDTSCKNDIVSKIWRSCHYRIIEKIRKFYRQERTPVIKSALEADLSSFLNDCIQFYTSLETLCQQQGHFELSNLFHGEQQYSSRTHLHQVKVGVYLIHHCYIVLGDLTRYLEELQQTPDWSNPRHYYVKAQLLVPKDGKPYNQLAVIAINAHRRLDAVYFYVRSYWTKNSFLSAYDSLIGLFDETTRKAQEDEKKSVTYTKSSKRTTEQYRSEVWYMPGHEATPITDDKQDLYQLQLPELSRKFTNSFLIVHGKLFTKIGIGQFPTALTDLLTILDVYLEVNTHHDSSKFLKMTAISISTIHHIIENTDDVYSQSVNLSLALSASLNFLTNLLKFCHKALQIQERCDDINDSLKITLSKLSLVLPSLRVWIMWLSTHTMLFESLKSRNVIDLDLWKFLSELSEVVNISQQILPLKLPIPASATLSCSKYWEDKMLAGFSCLTSLTNMTFEETLPIPDLNILNEDQLYYQTLSRCSLLHYTMISVLTDINNILPNILQYDNTSNLFNVQALPQKQVEVTIVIDEPDEDVTVKNEDAPSVNDIIQSPEIQQLKMEKERLSQQLEHQQKHEKTSQTLLDEVKKTKMEVVVKPRYLVPDTNCFVDYLKYLRQLFESGHFVIAVSLTVIGELEGLSKGTLEDKTSQTGSVDQLALEAVEYIKEKMTTSSPHLKALTSQGSLLSSLLLSSEEIADRSTNDDIILESCVKLHERIDSAHLVQEGGGVSEMHSVVLLTDDRNLRVKSHACHMPVRSVQKFLEML